MSQHWMVHTKGILPYNFICICSMILWFGSNYTWYKYACTYVMMARPVEFNITKLWRPYRYTGYWHILWTIIIHIITITHSLKHKHTHTKSRAGMWACTITTPWNKVTVLPGINQGRHSFTWVPSWQCSHGQWYFGQHLTLEDQIGDRLTIRGRFIKSTVLWERTPEQGRNPSLT